MKKQFVEAMLIRAARTVCQAALGAIGTATVMGDVNWAVVASTAVLAGVISVLTSIVTGLPEAE